MTPREAEVAADNLYQVMFRAKTRRAIRTKWQKIDFFGADVIAKVPGNEQVSAGTTYYAQVTMSKDIAGISKRKRKLEQQYWSPYDRPRVLRLIQKKGDNNRNEYFFRVYAFSPTQRTWHLQKEPWCIPKEMFKVKYAEEYFIAQTELTDTGMLQKQINMPYLVAGVDDGGESEQILKYLRGV